MGGSFAPFPPSRVEQSTTIHSYQKNIHFLQLIIQLTLYSAIGAMSILRPNRYLIAYVLTTLLLLYGVALLGYSRFHILSPNPPNPNKTSKLQMSSFFAGKRKPSPPGVHPSFQSFQRAGRRWRYQLPARLPSPLSKKPHNQTSPRDKFLL